MIAPNREPHSDTPLPAEHILIQGARQNNLKNLTLRLPLGKLIVITGVSGSGKSSLAFDTLYAEGQRRYVETFSTYARQFLDRMDRPRVERIEGIPPAIAIDQTNPVRTSRSTVGTMTEVNDLLKLLYARAARLFCGSCGNPVERDSAATILEKLFRTLVPEQSAEAGPAPLVVLITFTVVIPDNFTETEVRELLAGQGYTRIRGQQDRRLEVIQDRVQLGPRQRGRLVEDLEAALQHGRGQVTVYPLDSAGELQEPLHFSAGLHCPVCDIGYRDPIPNLFSFNSPIGACETCRGFGRTIGIDPLLVVPDERLSLAAGAVKPWQTESYRECQDDLLRFAGKASIPVDRPWRELNEAQKKWVLEGEGSWEDNLWYGVRRFFEWLETKSYRMHIRVLLSKYRAYNLCPACNGARLKPEALLWRLGADPGLNIHEVVQLPIDDCRDFFDTLTLPSALEEAAGQLLGEIRTRLTYLNTVGLGYLTLDRQSRTLSGGEVQRINLTTALGTSLVNTLFVLDEPSIGLHPRDIGRLINVLCQLRDSGNTVVVVEHDPELIRAADYVLDLGPGPGEAGGEVVFAGTLFEMLESDRSLTGRYLRGEEKVSYPKAKRFVTSRAGYLDILGAGQHNLKDIDVRLPLNRLVAITGVSGSGKSTLMQEICYYGLRQLLGRPVAAPGRFRSIRGHEQFGEVVLVDQAPIGRTARANPASYVGAFDAIRKAFAAEETARARGYTASFFSFNAGQGRCPVCAGSGFEHVEMQFLSDVYLRCPECDGSRYRPEILEVRLAGPPDAPDLSIADVLALTVAEADGFFSAYPQVRQQLWPLLDVGLGYLRLGQPLPTLSGGEAQRLKLAGHLAKGAKTAKGGRVTLFLFDEPTTGLHFADIAVLLQAFGKLLARGHSVVVIEHNLDVIRAADWVVDLGPEGGTAGGRVVCAGPPATIIACVQSHTGAALKRYLATGAALRPDGGERPETAAPPAPIRPEILIRHAREHNLQDIDLAIPRQGLTVLTGVSGSGKSTVAFDILFAEGQRRYLETLNAYARQYVQPAARPDVDGVYGVPPTVAIEQRTSRGGRKSTVATATEIYHFLRLLFVRLGTQFCPDCHLPIEPQSPAAILSSILRDYGGSNVQVLAPLVAARKGYYTDLAKWAAARGFAHLRVDGRMLPTSSWPRLDRYREHTIELPVGEIPIAPKSESVLRDLLSRALDLGKGTVSVLDMEAGQNARLYSTSRSCPSCGRSFPELDPRLFSFNSRHGWCPRCYGTGLQLPGFDERQTGEEIWWNEWWEGGESVCPACRGQRLRPEALAVNWQERTISDFVNMAVEEAAVFFRKIDWRGREGAIGREVGAEIAARLDFLQQVGLGYLALERAAPTLSGGEAQRIRLASQLGSNLRGVCYILDEPTIGLHARDTRMLLKTLHLLKARGNTVLVVEHDEETIRQADHILDLGPGGGPDGGRLVAAGTINDIMAAGGSITGRCLRRPPVHKRRARRPPPLAAADGTPGLLTVTGARLYNLKGFDLAIPLGLLICVTGVSGSGKSTLVREIVHENLHRRLAARRGSPRDRPGKGVTPRGCADLSGWQRINRVLEVDQRPIGRTPRSCPATYVGFWDRIRKLFAATPEANLHGYTASRFSFNTPKGGRCPDCAGQGMKKIAMSFLPDVTVACETCGGARFTSETLAVRYKGKDIAEVLRMSVDEAAEFFAVHRSIHEPLRLLQEVGLGYLTLGQQSPTLSGGEAQRIKLVTELAGERISAAARTMRAKTMPAAPHCLYVLDEPTIGLHMADVEKLVAVLHRLVESGNTVMVIEHNLDVIAEADWIIDLGPEGGAAGGRLVAQGPPAAIARRWKSSYTGRFLKEFLKARRTKSAAE
jgi:excinuclease ABC subunit A